MRTLLACLLLASWQQDPEIDRKVAALVQKFDTEELAARDAAEMELVKLGRPALQSLRRALTDASPEVRSRLERVISSLTKPRWMTDVAAAKAKAAELKKPLLVFSTIGPLDGYI